MTARAPVRVVGIALHRDRPVALELAVRAAEHLSARDIEVRIRAREAGAAGLERFVVADDAFATGLDVALSIGGDGTMLRTVDDVYPSGAAIVGVNVGQLGYLAEVEPADLEAALDAILRGDAEVGERMMLEVQVTSTGPANGRWFALNETVLEKIEPGRLIRLGVEINRAPFTTYAADGVIVATPTGSTAYSFSARGPIVAPRLRCLLLTPVSPHMLFDRALVLPADDALRFAVEDREVSLTIDGQVIGRLEPGASVSCSGAARPLRLLTIGAPDFHQLLKAKFGLADR